MTVAAQKQKLDDAKRILADLGLPRRQQNTRTALVLLSMFGVHPDLPWSNAHVNTLGITECMDWMVEHYPDIPKGREDPVRYQPNSRESVRKESVKPLITAGILVANSDDPDRATNDKNNNYHPAELALGTISTFGSPLWQTAISQFKEAHGDLSERQKATREAIHIPIEMPAGTIEKISPGAHSDLIIDILRSFAPQFTPGGKLVYLGDTRSKWIVQELDYFEELGITIDPHGKMPDVVLHHREKDWLVLVEAVTSTGPMSLQRVGELKHLFQGSRPGLVFVTAFPDKPKFKSFMADIAWETEVWIADNETHMIHFNGERFLGPYGNRPESSADISHQSVD